ncbi:hypothetical protein [Novosphingobium sp. Gsoil 351]|uniref:hypothetical protein n=1 Tax=Novosphingobium sp. Gsoil 351 TaxID=2675225 RepID=UPI0012B4C952|nr:hypothetical protein [Novosphingobium sp. Gsoil 351]QGN55130.1 hypothetical protein GKE62_11795 [Novosphingobium sp. Gsoil 351]
MLKNLIIGLVAASAIIAQPALGQYYPDSRSGRTGDKIARTIDEAARALGTVTDAFDRSLYEVRYRGAERFAIDACRPQVERYGRMRIDDVRPYKRSSFRVYGITEGYRDAYGDNYRYRNFGPRSFKCTVSDRGSVKVKTKRLRGY